MPIKDPEKRRECHKAYMKKWYSENKSKHQRFVSNRKDDLKEWFAEFKSTLSCTRCGESHFACLDFHHRNPAEKEVGLAHVMVKGWGKEKILAEVEKCDVLCSNCHRKLHYEEKSGNWAKKEVMRTQIQIE